MSAVLSKRDHSMFPDIVILALVDTGPEMHGIELATLLAVSLALGVADQFVVSREV